MPTGRGRRNEGFYFVVVDGVPQYCQWQELKDYLRDSVKVRPGHTNVVKVNEDGTRVGFCPLPDKAEANRAFEYLVAEGWRGLDIRVSLVWKSDLNSGEVERRRGPEQSRRRRHPMVTPLPPFPDHNSRLAGSRTTSIRYDRGLSVSGMYPSTYSDHSLQPINHTHRLPYMPYGLRASPYTSQTAPVHMEFQYTAPYAGQLNHSLAWSIGSNYSSLNLGLTSGSHPTEPDCVSEDSYFSVQVSGFPSDTKREEVESILEQYGSIRDLEMKQTTDHGLSVVARFQQFADISHVMQGLDGKSLMNSTLIVQCLESETGRTRSEISAPSRRSDSGDSTEVQGKSSSSVTVHNLGPLIVNGARGSRYYKRKSKDDDSESTGASSTSEDEIVCESRTNGLLRKRNTR